MSKIKEVSQIHVKSALAKDWTTYANTFLDDGVMYPPNDVAIKGRAAIRAWAAKFAPITEFKAITNEVHGRDDLAYALGTYSVTLAPPGSRAIFIQSRFAADPGCYTAKNLKLAVLVDRNDCGAHRQYPDVIEVA